MYDATTTTAASSPRGDAPSRDVRAIVASRRAAGERTPHEYWSKQIVSQFGLIVPDGRLVAPEQIGDLRLDGGPYAVKFMSPDVQHKSDLGAVRLNVPADQVASVCREMSQSAQLRQVRGDGFLVEEMAPSGVELALGGVIDSSFGPIVMLGTGGTLVELLDDVAIRLCPIDAVDAREMLRSLRTARLLEGFRGSQPLSTESVVEALLALGGEDGLLMYLADEIAEIDINPLIVNVSGAVAADAQIVLDAAAPTESSE